MFLSLDALHTRAELNSWSMNSKIIYYPGLYRKKSPFFGDWDVKPGASSMLGKHSTTELHPQPSNVVLTETLVNPVGSSGAEMDLQSCSDLRQGW